MLFLTIPTAGNRPDLLQNIIRNSGLPPEQILIVVTAKDAPSPRNCTVLEDLEPVNIQRWWLRGIEEAISQGATAVAVSNDDVIINTRTLQLLHESLKSSGATIASPARPDKKPGLHRRRLIPYSPVMWGSLWLLDVCQGLRPDTAYRWWYGDNDLVIRARRDHTGVVSVPVHFEHMHSGEATGLSSHLQALAEGDLARYQVEYARTIWMTDRVSAIKTFARNRFGGNRGRPDQISRGR